MFRPMTEKYCVLITDNNGKTKLLMADINRPEATGLAAGINLSSMATGQRAAAAGFFPVGPASSRFAYPAEETL